MKRFLRPRYDGPMKPLLTGFSIAVITAFAMFTASGAQAIELPPAKRCVTPILKTVKKGNRQAKPDRWFMRHLNRARCLDRAKPRQFKAFSARCKANSRSADSYLSRLQGNFILRLEAALLNNQPRLLNLDLKEASLLSERKTLNRRIRNSSSGRRTSLVRQRQSVDRQLITVRTKRARINYSMNTRAVTRRGAAGVWLAYFDGVAHGCLKAFRGSPYLNVMRKHFLLQLAAAQRVSPAPTRSGIATWTNLLSGHALAPAGSKK